MKLFFSTIVFLFIVVAQVEAYNVIYGEQYPKAYAPYAYHFTITVGMDLVQRSSDTVSYRWEITNGKIRDESGNYTLTTLTLNSMVPDYIFDNIYVVWECPNAYGELKYYRDNQLLVTQFVSISEKCDHLDIFDRNISAWDQVQIFGCTNVNLKNVVFESGANVYVDGFESVNISPAVTISDGSNVWIRAGGIGQSSFSGNQMRMAAGINMMESDGNKCTLKQNYPNPFSQTTSIDCFVPSIKTDAYIQITDIRGILVKKIPVTQIGWNEMQVDSSELGVGTYTYSLIVNNQLIESKQMFVIH